MQAIDMRGILAEEDTIQRRQEALRSLLIRRTKVLHESLKQRIIRARNNGEWIEFSPGERIEQYQEERTYLQSQIDELRAEQQQTRCRLSDVKRAKKRAEKMRAAEKAIGRNRR
jgi:hypothetical protein